MRQVDLPRRASSKSPRAFRGNSAAARWASPGLGSRKRAASMCCLRGNRQSQARQHQRVGGVRSARRARPRRAFSSSQWASANPPAAQQQLAHRQARLGVAGIDRQRRSGIGPARLVGVPAQKTAGQVQMRLGRIVVQGQRRAEVVLGPGRDRRGASATSPRPFSASARRGSYSSASANALAARDPARRAPGPRRPTPATPAQLRPEARRGIGAADQRSQGRRSRGAALHREFRR